MGIFDNQPADADKAKAVARAVQGRMKDLGHTVSLNHAYEAIATVFGHKTWSVMKAALEEPTSLSMTSKSTSVVGRRTSLEWSELVPSWHNRVVALHGGQGARRSKITHRLVSDWRDRLGGESLVCKVSIDDGAESAHDWTLNFFDTPYTSRKPDPEHLSWIADAVVEIITAVDGECDQTMYEAAHLAVPALYKWIEASPIAYRPGVAPQVDSAVEAWRETRPSQVVDNPTWWDIVDLLDWCGKSGLAAVAQRQASPRFEHLLAAIRTDEFERSLRLADHKAEVVERFSQAVSRALRQMRFLQRATNAEITADSGIVEMKIPAVGDEAMRSRLYHHALIALMAHVEVWSDDCPVMLLLESAPKSIMSGSNELVRDFLGNAHQKDRYLVVSGEDYRRASDLREWVGTHIVVGGVQPEITYGELHATCNAIDARDFVRAVDNIMKADPDAHLDRLLVVTEQFKVTVRELVEMPDFA